MELYRATLRNPIVFPESVIITAKNLNFIDLDKAIYCEISSMRAMSSKGGILIYILDDKDRLTTYETNMQTDQQAYDAISKRIDQNINLFVNYSGGFGNYVYVKKNAQLEIDEKYNCFWYHSQNTKLRINSSVKGIFLSVITEMKNQNSDKNL